MLPSRPTLTINVAFLLEVKEDSSEIRMLIADARRALASRTMSRLGQLRCCNLMGQLRDGLALYFAVEQAYGYFCGAADVPPQITQAARALCAEHESLYQAVADLAESAERRLHKRQRGRDVQTDCRKFDEFCHELHRHETEECRLMIEIAGAACGRPVGIPAAVGCSGY